MTMKLYEISLFLAGCSFTAILFFAINQSFVAAAINILPLALNLALWKATRP